MTSLAKTLRWRFLIVLAVIIVAFYYLLPSVVPGLPTWWTAMVDKIRLGLDLQGGMHLITEVQTEKAIENALNDTVNDLQEQLEEKRLNFIEIKLQPDQSIAVEFSDDTETDQFASLISDFFPYLEQIDVRTGSDLYMPILKLKDAEIERLKDSAVRQALETIRNRIDQFGVTEPLIQRQGADRILIQLPGIKEPERAKSLLRQTALLEFKLLNEDVPIDEALKGKLPPDSEVLYEKVVDQASGITKKVPFVIKKKTLLTGDLLEDAQARIDSSQFNEPYVSIRFNSKGAKVFARVTKENVGKRLAIVLDNSIYSAPMIREEIPGGRAQIEGSFTLNEANDLAIVLRAGSLPAPIKVLEERSVGPSLGQDSIQQGIRATIIGSLLVVVFMIIYYNFSGVVANLALVINILLIFAVLSIFGATLTLPGIAGIVLTIGMAVDANVLIFERIREELHAGKTPWAAVDSGYSKAFSAIFDSNLSSIIAAAVLFQFGTGPVRGFAVTLTIGLLANLFTAVFVTRIVYDYFVFVRKVKTISI
ncbi:MAG TPA: protein translocase subunit SecD [Thermodesulfobacteriota bacterium]|nr:protein translocase subunit SecD [Thermodesulfobacteriota bacterium]